MTSVLIVDYGAGNLRSAAHALETAAADMNVAVRVGADPAAIRAADRIVLPGVGAFADCRRGLDARPGLVEALNAAVIEGGRPFLGICVGMQLMASFGLEYGAHPGLDWIKGRIERLTPNDPTLKVPHMGWNNLRLHRPDHPVFADIKSGDHVYFVHSYCFIADDPETIMADVDYGGPVTAAVGLGNMLGVQFHPEKSQKVGLRLLKNFLAWKP